MLPTKEKIAGANYRLGFSLPADGFENMLESKLKDFAARHVEKGFRRGHVPMVKIKAKYEGAFVGETLDQLVNEALNSYIESKGVQLAAQAKVDLKEGWTRGKNVDFEAEFDIIPPMPAIDFSKISVEILKAEAGDREIDDSLANIADSRRTSEPVEPARETKKGDVAVIDFVGSVDGREFAGGQGSDYSLELGSGTFIPGFEEQLVGCDKGADVDVNVEFPKDYGSPDLSGKKALFKVKIKDIRTRKVPEINDAFAKELGRADLVDLRKYVKELLEDKYAQDAKMLARDEVLESLSKTKVDIPASLVDREIDFMIANNRADTSDEKALEKMKKEMRAEAENRVRLGLIVADIGKREQIRISEQDVQQAIMGEAMKDPAQAQRIFDIYMKNQNAQDAIRAGIFEDKVLDLILSKVTRKEKKTTLDDLNKRMKKND